jgi:SAM-dependent methyltransferase
MQEIPYSIISQWYQEEYSQQQSESVYGSPKKHLLNFFQVLELSENLTTVLDLGCGDGINTIALAEKGYEVTGIDIAGEEAVLYRARQKSLDTVKFITADIASYPFDQESYDCVLCAGVFHLLSAEQIEAVANKVKKALKPGGLIYLDIVANMKRIFRDSGEEFTFTGLANWSDSQAKEFFSSLFSDWSVLDMPSFHQEADWPVKPGNYPVAPYHWIADYVCVIAKRPTA